MFLSAEHEKSGYGKCGPLGAVRLVHVLLWSLYLCVMGIREPKYDVCWRCSGFCRRDSPGPSAYVVPGGMGRQQLSGKTSNPSWRVGTGQRSGVSDKQAANLPGAGNQRPPNCAAGTVFDADEQLSGVWSQKRTYLLLAGRYQLPGGLGKQVLGPKRSAATAKFGSSTRDGANKVFISAEHDKTSCGLASPGPGTANQVGILRC